MFSYPFPPCSPCRKRHGVFTLLAVSFLSTALLFTSCKTDDVFVDDNKLNKNLTGTWTSEHGDGYTITAANLSYSFGADIIGYAGTVEYVSNFTDNAGVIIIKYEAGKEQTYPVYDENWEIIGYKERTGDFAGIYFENLKPGVSVEMGVAVNLADYSGAEEKTLDAAKAAFTSGKKGDYIGMMGTYQKKP